MKFEEPQFGEKKKKEMEWRAIEQSVERTTDALGKEIDEHIKQAVIALKANGFGTTGSCEGHLDRGVPYPWVDVESRLAEELLGDRRYNELKEKAKAVAKGKAVMTDAEQKESTNLVESQISENKKEYERLTGLLEEFYEMGPEEPSGNTTRLTIRKGPWNQSRVQPSDVPKKMKSQEIQKMWSSTEKERRLKMYRDELGRFTEFLKRKFFGREV